MRVLVTAASKHGATEQIAAELASALTQVLSPRTAEVQMQPIEEVPDVGAFDAAVIGSAVYMGHWMDSARRLVKDYSAELNEQPVWLFSSGPIGDPLKPEEPSVDVTEVMTWSRAREHKVFAGRIDKGSLGFAERAVVRALKVPQGDFRNWTDIREWAEHIGAELNAEWSHAG